MDNIAKRKALFVGELMNQRFDQGGSITATELANAVGQRFIIGAKPTEKAIYTWVAWLRKEGKIPFLIADKQGYHRAKTKDEALSYMSMLEARIWMLRGRYNQIQGDMLKMP